MKFKKAQSEIITTVLIILLVLAAIVIVWQVVQGTVNKGAEQVEAQSSCIGLSISLVDAGGAGVVTLKPNKDIAGYRIYFNGVQQGTGDGSAVTAFSSASTTFNPGVGVEVTSAGKIGTQWCDGMEKIVAA
jgi:flagellin-like protein